MSVAYTHMWRAPDGDFPCVLTGREGPDADGRIFVEITHDNNATYVPQEQLIAFDIWKAEQSKAAQGTPHHRQLSATNAYFTVITSTVPDTLGKVYSVDAKKKLQKTAVASIATGTATTFEATPKNLLER